MRLLVDREGESPENLQIMATMDKHVLEEPTAGALTMQSMLQDNGITINIKRVRRLMRLANMTSTANRTPAISENHARNQAEISLCLRRFRLLTCAVLQSTGNVKN